MPTIPHMIEKNPIRWAATNQASQASMNYLSESEIFSQGTRTHTP
jgi:hypothetical protein